MTSTHKVVLAYSGGLDTSVAVHWLREQGHDVVTLTVDLGGAEVSLEGAAAKARAMGAEAHTVDARTEFIEGFVWPALQAGAIYGDAYPLATALGRPLIARLLVETARRVGATAVAHGCTGKGNDQVRFDVATALLAPGLTVLAPTRDWDMNREQEIEYARHHNIPVPTTLTSPYSVDANLWGRSIEAGILEDPWLEPPADVFEWTCDVNSTPSDPSCVEVGFETGLPVSLDGERLDPVTLVAELNRIAGAHGVGRIDQVEDRLIGIKSREIYEAPAAVTLHRAHRALEALVLTRDALQFKATVAAAYARVVYDGAWFSAFRDNLAAYVDSTQRYVTGTVRMRLERGSATVVGRTSPFSLYRHNLATYGPLDEFSQAAAAGFIQLWGLPLRVQASAQPTVAAPAVAGGPATSRTS